MVEHQQEWSGFGRACRSRLAHLSRRSVRRSRFPMFEPRLTIGEVGRLCEGGRPRRGHISRYAQPKNEGALKLAKVAATAEPRV
jgi:hypothetical protein